MTRNEYYAYLSSASDKLKHHGIAGMRWGKRNGPPYPLRTSERHKVDKKRINDLYKEYGSLEDKVTYGKHGNGLNSLSPENEKHLQRMHDIDKEVDAIKSTEEYKNGEKLDIAKKVAGTAALTGVALAGAYFGVQNKAVIDKFVKKVGKATVSSLKKNGKKSIDAGKEAVKLMKQGAKEGVKESLKEGPKRAVKAAGMGLMLLGMKELMDQTIGKETSAKVFQANNSKKISSFWKVYGDDKEERDDD